MGRRAWLAATGLVALLAVLPSTATIVDATEPVGSGSQAPARGAARGDLQPEPGRQLQQAAPRGRGKARTSLEISNGCAGDLTNVQLSYVGASGRSRRARATVIRAGSSKPITIRTAWPSTGTVSGRVRGGGTFEMAFEVSRSGEVLWAAGAQSLSGAARVADAACAAGGVLKASLSSLQAAPVAPAAPRIAPAAAAVPAAGGASAADGGQVSPMGDPATLKANPDNRTTELGTSVDIRFLVNDRIPNADNTEILLYTLGAADGVALTSIFRSTEGVDGNLTGIDTGDTWTWVPAGLDADPPSTTQFQQSSYLRFTPGSRKTISIGYTLLDYTNSTDPTNSSAIITIYVTKAASRPLVANDDYISLTYSSSNKYALVPNPLDNDEGPSLKGALLGVLSATSGAHGVVSFKNETSADGNPVSRFTYTVTDPYFKCGVDTFSYVAYDPDVAPARAKVTLVVLGGSGNPSANPTAQNRTYDKVSPTAPFYMTPLTNDPPVDELCGGQVLMSSPAYRVRDNQYWPATAAEVGRITRNGNMVMWTPPRGGINKTTTNGIYFSYSVGFRYPTKSGTQVASSSGRAVLCFAGKVAATDCTVGGGLGGSQNGTDGGGGGGDPGDGGGDPGDGGGDPGDGGGDPGDGGEGDYGGEGA